jgi:crotonobetainyl-CoA:carnitine CoA-transferase CaiB-like acyl-CoA transferase
MPSRKIPGGVAFQNFLLQQGMHPQLEFGCHLRWYNTSQLDEAKLAFGVVRPLSDFAESDWAKWWGALVEVDDRHGGTIRIPGAPWRFSSDALSHPGQPAYRGEHNVEILQELEFCRDDITRFVRLGVVMADESLKCG